jgi:hypothetical protein
MKGVGTNERGIIQHLAHRSFQEVEAIKVSCGLYIISLVWAGYVNLSAHASSPAWPSGPLSVARLLLHTCNTQVAFQAMYGKTLAQEIEEETSGLTRKFFLALVNVSPLMQVDDKWWRSYFNLDLNTRNCTSHRWLDCDCTILQTPRHDMELLDPERLDDGACDDVKTLSQHALYGRSSWSTHQTSILVNLPLRTHHRGGGFVQGWPRASRHERGRIHPHHLLPQ